jgi:hypothetical protein
VSGGEQVYGDTSFCIYWFFASRAVFTRKTFEESEVCHVSGGENREVRRISYRRSSQNNASTRSGEWNKKESRAPATAPALLLRVERGLALLYPFFKLVPQPLSLCSNPHRTSRSQSRSRLERRASRCCWGFAHRSQIALSGCSG